MNSSDEPDSASPQAMRAALVAENSPEPPRLIHRQRRVQANWNEVEDFLGRTGAALTRSSYTVCLVSDRTIRRYNGRFRHRDEATDVLSFPTAPDSPGKNCDLGDILISVEMAQTNAAYYGIRLEDEIKALILHGLLHLLGQDHERDRGRMARSERLWGVRLGLPQTLLARRPRTSARPNPKKSRSLSKVSRSRVPR